MLSGPTGGSLGSPSSATLKILDAVSQFSNNTGIQLTSATVGTPYPSTITISGQTNPVSGLRLSVTDVTALDGRNVELLLVDPSGTRKFTIMSAAGGDFPLNGATITFEDSASMLIPTSTAIADGQNYKPTKCTTSDNFPPPAPAGPYGDPGCTSTIATLSSVFTGANPNGTWSLYV